MADIADRAEEREAILRADGITRVRAAVAASGSLICVDCDEAIEPTRRAAMPAATRCSCCQHDFEHYARVQLSGGGGFYDPTPFNRGPR